MRQALYIFLLGMAMVACTVGNNGTHTAKTGNTLYTESRILDIYDTLPEQALLMIDSAVVVGNLEPLHADLLRAIVYSRTLQSFQNQDSARVIAERLLQSDSARTNAAFRQDVLEVLLNAARLQQDDEAIVLHASELANLCRMQGCETEALRNESEVGLALSHLTNWENGLHKIDSALAALGEVRRFNELDASVIAAKRKITVLTEQGRHADIIPVAKRIIERLNDYEQLPQDYHDGTYREPSDADRHGYIDFYRAQAYAFLASAFAHTSQMQEASHCLALCEQSDYGHTFDCKRVTLPTLCLLGQYDKMEAACKEIEAHLKEQGDTVIQDMATLLHCRATAAKARGQVAESLRLMEQYDQLKDLLRDRLVRSKAHLYAARFHAQEQDREIERQKTEVERSRLVSMLLSVVLAAVLLIALTFYVQKRKMKRKNRIHAAQIQEASVYREQLIKHRQQTESSTDAANPGSLTDEQLFSFLSDLIEREQLFLSPGFERQTLIDCTGLSKERIGAAFSVSGHDRLTAYIRDLRLQYAVHLMTDQPELSNTQVSAASGFASPDTFARNFRTKYGMSPTVFRQSKA